jgi:hypothetical protein
MDLFGMAGVPDRRYVFGAAHGSRLTYARRYALFTLVGIAGEVISTGRISVSIPTPQHSCREHRIIASNRTGKLRQRNRRLLVMGTLRRLQQGPSSEYSYRQAFRKPEEQLAGINSADEAALWAQRHMPAKNTLTAADSKMVKSSLRRGSPP